MESLTDEQGVTLDPFAFHGHPASCVVGLGGEAPPPDATYVFHTPYVPVARGHAHFTVRFSGLSARRGSLWLRVHMLPNAPGATASMATGNRLQFNWLAHHGGETRLRFEAFRGATYALMGLAPDGTDASAEGLTITLDRPASPEDLVAGAEEFAVGAPESIRTAFATDAVRDVALMVSLDPPVFAHPVSQPRTAEQLREPAWRERTGRRGDVEAWPAAFTLQALDRYGALRPGARGLALGAGAAALAEAVSTAGATCHIAHLPGEGVESPIDPAGLPGDLSGFDFLFSIRATDALDGDAAARRFIDGSMECLRPGGLALHVVTHMPRPVILPGTAFDRGGLERLVLGLVSRGHQAARLKLPAAWLPTDPDGTVPFGLIARRANAIL